VQIVEEIPRDPHDRKVERVLAGPA
jgi:5-formyltetrahydrofolate cyclo-ligase